MKSVLVRVQEYRTQAHGAEIALINYFLEHPDETAKLSIHVLSEKSYTSPATIIRFCKKLGFRGYKEFIVSLNYELALRSSKNKDIGEEINKGDSLEDIVDKVTYRNIQALEDTRKLVDLDEMQRCIDVLVAAKTVGLFGIGSSLLAAKDMYLKFLRLNKPCICCDDLHLQIIYAKNLTSMDAAVIFSYSGLTQEIISSAKLLKNQNVPVITITRFAENELTRMSDYKLYVSANELLVRTAATASRISQLNMIDILFSAYVNQNHDRNMNILKGNVIEKNKNNTD
ncbi:MAG: MurR/RpiR family transcriptional regulator [Lachnospiraceae bacterium]